MSVALTIATTDYDHFRDFRLGLVRPEGIEVNWLAADTGGVVSGRPDDIAVNVGRPGS